VLQPGTDEIAARAGVSPRSLFRYFDDVDDLVHAAIERHLGALFPLREVDAAPNDTTEVKIDRLVESRARLYEAIAPAARAGRVAAHRHDEVAAQIRDARAFWRKQVKALFAPELADRPELLPAIDALCSFESYELLRHDQRLSRPKAAAALKAALTRLLGP
jgi:AcrR family transcriptional regulator